MAVCVTIFSNNSNQIDNNKMKHMQHIYIVVAMNVMNLTLHLIPIIRSVALWQLSNKGLYSAPPAFTKSDSLAPTEIFLFFKLFNKKIKIKL